MCANCELEKNRVTETVEKIFICFNRFDNEVGSICFISKYILQLNLPTIISIDEIKRIIISIRKNKAST